MLKAADGDHISIISVIKTNSYNSSLIVIIQFTLSNLEG